MGNEKQNSERVLAIETQLRVIEKAVVSRVVTMDAKEAKRLKDEHRKLTLEKRALARKSS